MFQEGKHEQVKILEKNERKRDLGRRGEWEGETDTKTERGRERKREREKKERKRDKESKKMLGLKGWEERSEALSACLTPSRRTSDCGL